MRGFRHGWKARACREGYATVVVDNVNYSGVMPGKVTNLMPAIEWPVVMPQLLSAFRGEIGVAEAMEAAAGAARPRSCRPVTS